MNTKQREESLRLIVDNTVRELSVPGADRQSILDQGAMAAELKLAEFTEMVEVRELSRSLLW